MSSVELNPILDGYINSDNPTFNYGVTTALVIGSASGSNMRRPIMVFDLTSYPAINSAVLQLAFNTVSVGTNPAKIRQLTDSTPVEGTGNGSATGDGMTWNTYDGSNNWTAAGGKSSTTNAYAFNLPNSTGFQTFNISDLVVPNAGSLMPLIIQLDDEASTTASCSFRSKEFSIAANRPKLTLNLPSPSKRYIPGLPSDILTGLLLP